MSRFLIKSKARLSTAAKIGATLVVVGPIATAILYWVAATQNTYGGATLLMALTGFATLVGFVLWLSGREYEHEVTVLSDK